MPTSRLPLCSRPWAGPLLAMALSLPAAAHAVDGCLVKKKTKLMVSESNNKKSRE